MGLSRTYKICFFIIILIYATACSANEDFKTKYTARQLADAVISSQSFINSKNLLTPDDEYYQVYLQDIYLIEPDNIIDGVIYYSAGMLADEIAVLIFSDNTDAAQITSYLEEYIGRRIAAFTGYAPDQAAILENGRVFIKSNVAALIICQDMNSAQAAFDACFSRTSPYPEPPLVSNTADPPTDSPAITEDKTPAPTPLPAPASPPAADIQDTPAHTATPTPTPTPTPAPTPTPDPADINDLYDPLSIITAWRSGDTSALTPKNKAIFDAAGRVINSVTNDSMDDYEKELAVHNWIIINAEYDKQANNNAPDATPDPNNDNPYGLLINGNAICTGYTYTFQLFMDLLGIECITIHGKAITGGDHAWNMVRINGEWYCVDVTWNDPTNAENTLGRSNYTYFNVPTRVIINAGHQWDDSNTPVATAPKLSPY